MFTLAAALVIACARSVGVLSREDSRGVWRALSSVHMASSRQPQRAQA